MATVGYIVQTCCTGFILIFLKLFFLLLRRIWLNAAIKTRENYNKKHKLHPCRGLAEVNSTGLSYQIDTIEGCVAFLVLFVIGLLFSLFVPLQRDNLFCVLSTVLSLAMFCYCWFMRNSGTNMYKVLVYIFCGVSLIFVIHIFVSLALNDKVLIDYTNSFNVLLYIWSVMLMDKLLTSRKKKEKTGQKTGDGSVS